MSTFTTAPSAVPAATAQPKTVANPLVWLLVILAIGLAVRAFRITSPFQLDEFSALQAVAERQGVPRGLTPTAEDPLVPVAGLAEVRQHSVIPYGIPDPVPLYHYLLYGVLQVLPIADWSLRLPSLLAGLGCIVAVYFLARRLFGAEVALVAAAVVALEPIQVTLGWLAQPYAVANLSCALSFVALWGLLEVRTPILGALCGLGYGLCLAVTGYLVPVMLLAVIAHVVILVIALRSPRRTGAGWRAGFWLAGTALGAALLVPEYAYWGQLWQFGREHRDYLLRNQPIRLGTFLWHNLSFLLGLVLVQAAAMIVRWQVEGEPAPESAAQGEGAGNPAAAPAETTPKRELELAPLPDNDEGTWLARIWVFLPQLVAIVAAYVTAQSIFVTPFLSFTTLGAALLLAYYATREPSREVRLGVSVSLAVAMLVMGFWPSWFGGVGVQSITRPQVFMADVTHPDKGLDTSWREGDVILVRSGLLEADFVRTAIPAATRSEVERVMVAPLTTLYPDTRRRPVIPLTRSLYRSDSVATLFGPLCKEDARAYYDRELADQLKGYKRFWMTGLANTPHPNDPVFLACFLPWLAEALDRDLEISRNRGTRGDPERYVAIPRGLSQKPDEPIDGLTENVRSTDFNVFVHLVKEKPAKATPAEDRPAR
jgi:4-amino-4-deoxy-L-arabinose transferase-like glycosyltransferase